MSTGWNFNYNSKESKQKKDRDREKKRRQNKHDYDKDPEEKTNKNYEKVLPRIGLNCGPAGRRSLMQWIEYNYKMKIDEEDRNPGVNACKIWQKTQSFQDPVLSGLVDFLKFLSVPKHITYKTIFDNYLSPKFINKIHSMRPNQKSLIKLAHQMKQLFQVREIQPLFSKVLEKIEVIPLSILHVLVQDTPAASYFYELTSVHVKRSIWILRPHKFFEEIESIVEEIIFRMEVKNSSEITTTLIGKLVSLIGSGKENRCLYSLCIHILRLKCLESSLNTKEYTTTVSYSEKPSYEKALDPMRLQNIQHSELREESMASSKKSMDDLEGKLKNLQNYFDNIMNQPQKEEIRKKDSFKFRDSGKLFYIDMQNYDHANNSTSFHFLKKRKKLEKVDIIGEEFNEQKKDQINKKYTEKVVTKKDTNGDLCPFDDPTNCLKRSLTMLSTEEEKDSKRIKTDLSNRQSQVYFENDIRNNNNNDMNEERENLPKDYSFPNSGTIKEMNEPKSNKAQSEEYHRNKTILPFSFDHMYYSNLRLLLCMQYKDTYNLNEEEMASIDKYYYVIEFINNIIKNGNLSFQDKSTFEEITNKSKKYLEIKNLDDLYEYSLLFSNILLKFVIVEGICFYFYKNSSFSILTLKEEITLWISIFYFGVYVNFIALIKYAMDQMDHQEKYIEEKEMNVLSEEEEQTENGTSVLSNCLDDVYIESDFTSETSIFCKESFNENTKNLREHVHRNVFYKHPTSSYRDSNFKISLSTILNYIMIPNNKKNSFYCFFDYLNEDSTENMQEVKEAKEKNSIILLTSLLHIPHLDYLKIKNFFSIIDEILYVEKENLSSISAEPKQMNLGKNTAHHVYPSKQEQLMQNLKLNDIAHNSQTADRLELKESGERHMKVQDSLTQYMNTTNKEKVGTGTGNGTETKGEDPTKKGNIENHLHLLKKKEISELISKKLISCIKDLNTSICVNEFLVNHQIKSVYVEDSKESMQFFDKSNIIEGTVLETTNERIQYYLKYIWEKCSHILEFFSKNHILPLFKKHLHLYGHFYQMILNRMLFISTVKNFMLLQNIILKELHLYFEEFKILKDENHVWKFFLYAHTLLRINKAKIASGDKLFHKNVLDYFMKLFYYLSFYNATFSILFLKILKTPLFFKHLGKKRLEILQNLWKGINERSLYFSKQKKNSIEYKMWLDIYNEIMKQ